MDQPQRSLYHHDFLGSHCVRPFRTSHHPLQEPRFKFAEMLSFFAKCRNIVISKLNVTITTYSGSQASDRGFDILCQNTTAAALYGSTTSAKDPGCLHGTRRDVQNHIFKWLDDPGAELAMWMYGPAGIGKTAIAQTIARVSAERGQLLSAFFFARSEEGRNSVKHLVPTLVFEILQQMPHMRDIICTAIAKNPLLFSAPLERQIRTTILPALSQHSATPNPSYDPMLIIIDGVDECTDIDTQKLLIRSFITLLAATASSTRHKILIVSRPESHIVSTFSNIDIARPPRHLRLDDWNTGRDIEVFLRSELQKVHKTHPSKPYLDKWTRWPSDESFERLLHKSLQSFAYASLAIRYIDSHERHPETSLQNLLGLSPDRAYRAHADLDSLYRHILESLNEETRYTARKILCLYTYLSVDDIEALGSLLGEEAFVVQLAIVRLSSVIRLEQRRISYFHTSFNDFLVDQERSGALYIYAPDVASTIARALPRFRVDQHTTEDYNLLEEIRRRRAQSMSPRRITEVQQNQGPGKKQKQVQNKIGRQGEMEDDHSDDVDDDVSEGDEGFGGLPSRRSAATHSMQWSGGSPGRSYLAFSRLSAISKHRAQKAI